jgi:hypothetical protein
MNTLFGKGAEPIIQRINNLDPQQQPLWGKMSAAQMLRHCQAPARVALGDLKLKRNLSGILLGSIIKRFLLRDGPIMRNAPTHPAFRVPEIPDFDAERQRLISLIRRIADGGPEIITRDAHPVFGKMSVREWDLLQWKHLDHHLRQFGA